MRRALAAAATIGALVVAVAVAAQADVVTGGNARVGFHGSILPHKLPRGDAAPISLKVAGTLKPIGNQRPAGIRRVEIAINRHGVVSTRGLPVCPRRRLLSRTSGEALRACPGALVGTGTFTSHVDIPEQAPFPAVGRMLAFNSKINGHRALYAHVYGNDPVPNAEVIPMTVRQESSGQFGSTLTVTMPNVGNEWGYVTGFDLTLDRRYRFRGRERSFLSASCPAPKDVAEVPYKAARGTFFLSEGPPITRVVSSHCRVASS